MARSDWAALITEPAAEYLAHTELRRYGLDPYLPQIKKRHHARTGKYVMRTYPIFPRYLLIRYQDAHNPAIRLARGICRYKHVLSDDDGRPWRSPSRIIEAVQEAERTGRFDELLHKGDNVTLSHGVLATIKAVLNTDAASGTVEILTPLFGGARVRIDHAKLAHA